MSGAAQLDRTETGAPSGQIVPRHPVVFCHGMLGMTLLHREKLAGGNYFFCLKDRLQELGVPALFPAVEGIGAVAARAEQLRDQIRRWTAEPVNLIAHSLGGLDARFMISRLGMGERVKSLTTLGTPHRGTPAAEWFCSGIGRLLMPLAALLGIDVRGLRDCTRRACAEFNERTPDHPGTRYLSVIARAELVRVSPLLRRSWCIVRSAEGANDGIVPVHSALWGECLETVPVDHFTITPDGLFRHPSEKFDAMPLYGRLLRELARRGI